MSTRKRGFPYNLHFTEISSYSWLHSKGNAAASLQCFPMTSFLCQNELEQLQLYCQTATSCSTGEDDVHCLIQENCISLYTSCPNSYLVTYKYLNQEINFFHIFLIFYPVQTLWNARQTVKKCTAFKEHNVISYPPNVINEKSSGSKRCCMTNLCTVNSVFIITDELY